MDSAFIEYMGNVWVSVVSWQFCLRGYWAGCELCVARLCERMGGRRHINIPP